MFTVYIIFSEKLNRYNVGTTDDVERRLIEHNSVKHQNSFTSRGIPWTEYLRINDLESSQAYKIEAHIKKMKSITYIENLKKYPDLILKLKLKFK